MVRRYEAGEDSVSIAKDYPIRDQRVRTLLRSRGVNVKRRGRDRFVDNNGYIKVRVDPNDPIAMAMKFENNSYLQEHRLIMAREIGRPLTSSETVHHKDGNRTNNVIENLQLRQGNHGRGAVFYCGDCGGNNVIAGNIDDPMV